VWRTPLVLGAAASGVVLATAVALAFSPWARVRNVTWTGVLQLPAARCATIETAALGRPLLFLSEAALQDRAQIDNKYLRLRLRRHLPSTLEVRLESRRAVAQIGPQAAVDRDGRVLSPEHWVEGLPALRGFELDAGGRALERRDVLAAILPLFELPTLAPSRIELAADGDELDLQLADSGARVRVDADAAAAQLVKLRVFEQSLGGEPMPERVDLRFQDQVVVRNGGGRDARRAR
jgi:cell division septal protein FtsQ